ncbi:transglycosylase domain-containing protein [Bifidobacterium favimelis]|uniref:Transglycosylase domain-containing protein n=2 Tax=Bifidobacterium favimelis TaxID=3122979 RepID=A0ABU8ZLB1_9BIFI
MTRQTRTTTSSPGRTPRTASSHPAHGTTGRGLKRNGAGNARKTYRVRRGAEPNRGARRGRPKKPHRILKWVLGIIGALLVAGAGLFVYMYVTTDIIPPEKQALAQKTTVYFSDGTTPAGTFADQDREIIDCSVLPGYVGNAIVASENRTFYKDSGIDLKGIGRALINNVTKGTRQGGSTITQQYAERYYLGETTTYRGKLREAFLALKIARTETKDTVLCNYMNTIYFGRGAYGIQAAAHNFYNKDAKDLTLEESATLAGIIPAPTAWDPAVNPKQAESRFHRVLGIMAEDNYIKASQRDGAKMPQTVNFTRQNTFAGPNGYLLTMVRKELSTGKGAPFTPDELDTGGYKIITTVDKGKQDLMFQTASPGSPSNRGMPAGIQVGGLSVNPKDGSIISFYAGDDYLKQQLNNVDQASFQVGSTMKVFTLLGAIQDGTSLDTVFNGNSPRTFASVGRSVSNAGNASYGYINLSTALAKSVNTVFMDLNEHVTAAKTAQVAHTAGITGRIDDSTTFDTLGVDALTAYDLAQGYSTLANGGSKVRLHMVARVIGPDGQELYKASAKPEQVFDADQVALLQGAMQGTVQFGTGSYARSLGRPIAAKTGTANDDTAVAFAGFTPSVLTVFGIWNPGQDGSAQKIPNFLGYARGNGYQSVLFTRYMKDALEGTPVEQFPQAVDRGRVGGPDGTWGTGTRSNPNRPTWPRPRQEDRRQEGNDGNGGQQTGDGGAGNGNENEAGNGGGNDGSGHQGEEGQQGGATSPGGPEGNGTPPEHGDGSDHHPE